jgi:CelD/BcsL family acetyltransferase involved in cellulose biosynthesis
MAQRHSLAMVYVPTSATGDCLIFQAYQGLQGFERLLPEWNELLRSIPEVRFNQYPEWYRAYLSSSLEPDANRIWFIAGYRNEILQAVFPLQLYTTRVGLLRHRQLGTIEHDQMLLSDFVFAQTPENQDLLDELTRWLRSQRSIRWDELRLRRVSAESSIAYSARVRLPQAMAALRFPASAYFCTRGTYEQATQAMTSKFRSNLRRRNRIAEESAPLRHRVYRTQAELREAFELFLAIEASGWKGDAGTSSAIRCLPAMLAFYAALVREFGARDACVINLLWHGDEPVAGELCLQIGRTLNILKVGFKEAHHKFAPGLLLLDRMIRQACDDPGIDVLHMVNNPTWAEFFKPLITEVMVYFAPNWNASGLVVHAGKLAKHKGEVWRNGAAGKVIPLVERESGGNGAPGA